MDMQTKNDIIQFCPFCGTKLDEGARFCKSCGKAIIQSKSEKIQSHQGVSENNSTRRIVYEGSVHKCPNCGEVLNSFVSVCSSCGYELRGASVSNAIQQFSDKLTLTQDLQEKINIISNFPIPNTKEDIWEFMIMAISNTSNPLEESILFAWQIKSEQLYNKAQLVFYDKKEFSVFEQKYNKLNMNLRRKKKAGLLKKYINDLGQLLPVFPQIIVVTLWLVSLFGILPLCRLNGDSVKATGFQLLFLFDLIIGTIFIPFAMRCKSVLPKLIVTTGLALSLIFLIFLSTNTPDDVNRTGFLLLLIFEIVCVITILIRTFNKKHTIPLDEKIKNNTLSLIIVISCIILFLVVYGIGVFRSPEEVQQTSQAPSIEETDDTNEEAGIYTYSIKNYVGRNLASIGEQRQDYLVDEYGDGELKIILITQDGSIVYPTETDVLKEYIVVSQNIPADTHITIVNLRDNKGNPYSLLVDYQSYDEIILYVSHIGNESFKPISTLPTPTLDRHIYHVRDYVGRNAASCGNYCGEKFIDNYGNADLKISFMSEDGIYIDVTDKELIRQYTVVSQDIEVNTELTLEYETDSKGEEYDNLISNQNYDEIMLKVEKLDSDVIEKMPEIPVVKEDTTSEERVELTLKYKVLSGGKAEITGFSGDGNHATIDSKIDGYEIIKIGDGAFEGCTTLESILFWADIETIGNSAFKDCINLKSISIPNETTVVEDYAFQNCTNLEDVILWGDSDIGKYTFSDCISLSSISIGYDTKSVGAHAFDGCTALSQVIIWNDDTKIERNAFANCPNLNRPIQE